LSPADLPKEGGRFDLPIAVGILAASGQLPHRALARREFYGELALGGELRETSKLLPADICTNHVSEAVNLRALDRVIC
jgi:magnesium chelatase family protein